MQQVRVIVELMTMMRGDKDGRHAIRIYGCVAMQERLKFADRSQVRPPLSRPLCAADNGSSARHRRSLLNEVSPAACRRVLSDNVPLGLRDDIGIGLLRSRLDRVRGAIEKALNLSPLRKEDRSPNVVR
jgi:hypothetical protein